jgi:segregation and condensation protein B
VDEILLVEALLFSSGRPFSLKELGEALDLEPQTVRKYIKKLKGFYGKRNTALEVAKVGSKYCLQVKREYVGNTSRFVRTKIPPKLLKTLAYIAYHQPVKQSTLVHLMGTRIYVEVKNLKKLELIHRKRSGHTKILTTSSKFPEYFGIGTSTREGIKNWLREKMGMKDDEVPVGEVKEEPGDEGQQVIEEKQSNNETQKGEEVDSTIDESQKGEEGEQIADELQQGEQGNPANDEKQSKDEGGEAGAEEK